MWGTVPTVAGSKFHDGDQVEQPLFQAPVREADNLSYGPLLVGMAACHSLTLIDESLVGDPLDLKVSSKLIHLR